jgi:hypothetical protein
VDGYGTLLHHLSTSFTLVALMMHMFPRDRALTAGCIVPIMQHMFILVKYHAHNTYMFLELALEFWFQWEVIWNIPAFETHLGLEVTRIGRGMAMTMLLAHYLYLTGSVLHMLDGMMKSKASALDSKPKLSIARRDTMSQMLETAVRRQSRKRSIIRSVIHEAESITQAVGSAIHEVEAVVKEGGAQAGKCGKSLATAVHEVEVDVIRSGRRVSTHLHAHVPVST